jgi:hypothetical protein
MTAYYAIGIDLGTTNSVLAYAPLGTEKPDVKVLPIPQLVAGSTAEPRDMLPSFLYLGTDAEAKEGTLDLPWSKNADYAMGAMAYKQAADTPTRTVVAAKSWLAYSKVDRHQPILPWGAPEEVNKVSPVEASTRYLKHLVAAWAAAFPNAPFAQQQVVLTVPASFDPSARDLTCEAALKAGFPENFILLEEPQAALYAWLADMGDKWRKQLNVGDTLLVCDVGGGTTDFTLIGVAEEDGELVLRRIAVGNHTLVGGDNMDLALAHFAQTAFAEKGHQLNAWQSVSLWHSCRIAKETLLGEKPPKKHPVTILGRGSKLVGGTVSVDLDRETVSKLLVDGFFPVCALADKPAKRRVSGFREIGLPFETDTAITRHLAAFLTANLDVARASRPCAAPAASATGETPVPHALTDILFNGGVFKAPALRDRLLEVLQQWFPDSAPRLLEGRHDLDFAVARGAAYYAFAKQGKGVRIRGGAARSYYVGIETSGLAIPGVPRPLRALCVVPFGMEEGTEVDVPSEPVGLVVGEPTTFAFLASSTRKQDKPGDVLDSWPEGELAETDPIQAHLPATEPNEEGYVPVKFKSRITELGVFELWCVSQISPQQWKLEFSVREEAE